MSIRPPELEPFVAMSMRTQLQHAVLSSADRGLFAEFGVASGKTAAKILEWMPQFKELHLFDSFYGLPEQWEWNSETGEGHPKGHFGRGGAPPNLTDPRAQFHIGLFEDTVEKWASQQDQAMSFVHIDSDLYSSCVTVLEGIEGLLQTGTVIQFDEIQGFPDYEKHEYRAWMEFIERTGWEWEWLSRTEYFQAAVKLL